MEIRSILDLYASSPQTEALMKVVCDDKIRTVSLKGLHASSIPAMFASLAGILPETCLFILNDN